jgi:hypothetical protein
MGARRLLPWHDSRYRSWYLNKIQYVQSVATSGFKFVVLHDVFIVHRPHKTRKQPQPRNTTRPAGNNSGVSSITLWPLILLCTQALHERK